MPSVVYEIDPLADTIIILKNPCRNFAPWDETNSRPPSVPEDNGERAEPSNGYLSEEHDLVQDPDGGVEDPSAEPAEPASEPTESENDEVHYLVSSRHLMLASPWFRRILTSEGSIEALKDPSDGRYHIAASDWDEEAFLILLSIFHVRTRQVPATVSLEMLTKIAVLVDYYELESAEVMERDTRDWIADVRRSVAIPTSYCRDLMLWICISRVFSMGEEFEKTTAVVIKESQGWIQTLGLPIHQGTTSRIERSRCDAIEHVISEFHRLLDIYRDFNYSCPKYPSYSFQCGTFLFGALMKYMEKWGYISPRPESPFVGINLNGVCNAGKEARNPNWWHRRIHYSINSSDGLQHNEAHSCSLNSKIDEIVRNAMAKVKGLKLQDLKQNSQVL